MAERAAGNLEAISEDLRTLTRVLRTQGAVCSAGLLGGEDGYGAYFENEVFAMHPYCWCEQDDCPWCAGCACEDDAWSYLVAGKQVRFEVWLEAPSEDRTTVKDSAKACAYCRGEKESAPNFVHKPSGSRIHWYKYIGRGMDVDLRADWDTLMSECLRSL